MKKIAWIILIIIAVFALGIFLWGDLSRLYFRPTDSEVPKGTSSEETEEVEDIAVVAENLSIPWDVAFLPNGEMLVTERTGTLARIGSGGQVERIEVLGIAPRGEGGLLGIALHPDFEENNWTYLYETYSQNGIKNRVVRYTLGDNALEEPFIIIDDIPGAPYHDGGRIRFGPDGLLYITTGDAGVEGNAQDINSLAGKILRLHDDGRVPEENPFGTAIFSYGHRNPQGLAWDNDGRLWSTEHGRSGVRSGFDELNLIEAGANYGWPVIEGDEDRERMRTPVLHSGATDTWAPASAVFWDGSIFWGGLRGEALYEARLDGTQVLDLKRHFFGEFGRIRSVVLGPPPSPAAGQANVFFYITTSNTDGRGNSRDGDDKIIRINPQIFR